MNANKNRVALPIRIWMFLGLAMAMNNHDAFAADFTYPILNTGQTKTYNESAEIAPPSPGQDYYGQDAQFAGAPANFTLSADGKTVSESTTGLMWQKTPDPAHLPWRKAVDYCDALSLSGHEDWHIPSLKELFSISDFSKGWPYFDTHYFDLAESPVSKDEQYWSSNFYVGITVEAQSEAAFGVNHGTGHIKAYPATVTGRMAKRVRCVRGKRYGVNDFANNGDGTITDKATGLMWMQADSGSSMDWKQALAWTQAKNAENLLGHNDWRLPNVKELQSIVDYTRSPTATKSEKKGPAIDPLFQCSPITNEAGDPDFPYYWTSTSAKFGASDTTYPYAWYVAFGRAVNADGLDFHGAGGVRFDTKVKGGPAGEGGERYHNYVRLVRTTK